MHKRTLLIPPLCLITPALCEVYPRLSFEKACACFLSDLEKHFKKGIKLVQLRQKQLSFSDYQTLARRVIALARTYESQVLLNSTIELVTELQVDGVHLPVALWSKQAKRPLPDRFMLGVSCHNLTELQVVQKLNPDFSVLSPVMRSASHPNTPLLGWDGFAEAVKHVKTPLFALGGLRPRHLKKAQRLGGHGVAGIRGFW